MLRIACVGSGPACLLLALAIKKSRAAREVTVFRQGAAADADAEFVLSRQPRRDVAGKLESLLGVSLPLHRLRRTDVFLRGERTSVAGGFAGAIPQAWLTRALEEAARAEGCEIRRGEAINSDLAGYDLIACDELSTSLADRRFACDMAPQRTRAASFTATRLAADRVLDVVEIGDTIFLGHGYAVSGNEAVYFVEATDEAWSSRGLLDADPEALRAFAAAFSRSLDGASLTGGRWHDRIAAPRQWCDGKLVLIGGTASAAHPSFLLRRELALDDALALAAALAHESSVATALERYEQGRRKVALSAARASACELDWLEHLHRYVDLPPLLFAFNALTRSLRVNHRDLQRIAPDFVRKVDQHFADIPPEQAPPPPMFVPFTLRGLTLENRIGVSPMCMYRADDGTVNDFHLVHLGSRAIGGAGLVFTEMTNVSAEGRITHGCAGMYKREHVVAWRRIVDYVHAHSSAKIAIQLAHAGRRASTARPWEGNSVPPPEGGWETLGPSPTPYAATMPPPREMTHADIERVVADFARASAWSEEAGFDLLELHMAHGYLLSTFLSPLSNLRSDEFGGSLKGRARFPLEVVRAVRTSWPDKPLSVRISAVDWSPGGSTIEQMIDFSWMLKEAGVDIIDVSTGNVVNVRRPTTGRLFQTPFSDQIRNEVRIPTMTVGRLASYGDINAILAAGRADLCLLAKGHLKDPYFTRHAAETLGHRLPWPESYATAAEFSLRREE